MTTKTPTDRWIVIDHLSPYEFKYVLEAARAADVNKGGYWDGTSACCNLWAGPDNKPSGWPADVAITQGALEHPRSYVAFVDMDWPETGEFSWSDSKTTYPIRAQITIYDLGRHGMGSSERCEGDLAWVKQEWEKLLAAGRARIPAPLRLELGAVDGDCLKCGGPLRLIVKVISSPWENGVGDWKHYCPICKTLTVPARDALAMRDTGRKIDGELGPSIGFVFGQGV